MKRLLVLALLLAIASASRERAHASECVSASVTYHSTSTPYNSVWFYWTPTDGYDKAGETIYCTECDVMETFTVTTAGGYVLGHKIVGGYRTGYWCND